MNQTTTSSAKYAARRTAL